MKLDFAFNLALVLLQVNNAAILVRGAWDESTYNETMAVNVVGPLSLTQQLTHMMPQGALVIMVSSGVSNCRRCMCIDTGLAPFPNPVPALCARH